MLFSSNLRGSPTPASQRPGLQTPVCSRRSSVLCGLSALAAFAGLPRGSFAQLRPQQRSPRSCILLWLDGGPSHLEMFDPKPDAPLEVRGPFESIQTSVPGIHLCSELPRTAAMTEQLAIIRSLTSPLGEHGLANAYVLTGYPPSPVLQYPSIPAVASALRPRLPKQLLPQWVAIPEAGSATPGFLSGETQPFTTGGDPAKPDFKVRDLELFPGIDEQRMRRRMQYLEAWDLNRIRAASQNPTADDELRTALRMASSAAVKTAFDLQQEPAELRQAYGPRMFGQSCLLARRLIQHGVPFVTVNFTGWDTHENLVLQLREGYSGAKQGVGLLPTFDQAFSALLTDLKQCGLLESTLVVALGEFGRTPKLNVRGGRDHWPRVFSAVLAGGGVPGGQVVGSSDRTGESPLDQPVTPRDLAATIYTLLGIDPEEVLTAPDGRPIPLVQDAAPIPQLLAGQPGTGIE